MKCPLLHGNMQKETDTEESIYYALLRFAGQSTQPPEAVNTK